MDSAHLSLNTVAQACARHTTECRNEHRVPKLLVALFCCAMPILAGGCESSSELTSGEHTHETQHEEGYERGPHGGRMLTDGSFAVELQIFEQGVPPQFRVYGYQDREPIDPSSLSVTIRLSRLAGRVDEFVLKPTDTFLSSPQEVEEPHSFDVSVEAQYEGKQHSWSYASYEGRIEMSPDVAEHSGVTTEKVVPRSIRTIRRARGKIVPSEHRIAHVIPRFAGVVREGRKHIGDRVERGEVLAIIESNQSLQPFEVRSQISGTIVNGHLIVGEYVPENQSVYIVADISEVWADFLVPLRESGDIAKGQKVFISSVTGSATKEGYVSYVAPYADERSQAQLVRVIVPNEDGTFVPGMFITGDVVVADATVPVAIKREGIQRFRDWSVVFVRVGNVFEARPIELGRSDGEWVEVLRGLRAGDEYVVGNSFLMKADALKAGASHDH
jgi:cobalt-zinc-cadmium efflux system membrane fusion protein